MVGKLVHGRLLGAAMERLIYCMQQKNPLRHKNRSHAPLSLCVCVLSLLYIDPRRSSLRTRLVSHTLRKEKSTHTHRHTHFRYDINKLPVETAEHADEQEDGQQDVNSTERSGNANGEQILAACRWADRNDRFCNQQRQHNQATCCNNNDWTTAGSLQVILPNSSTDAWSLPSLLAARQQY